MLPGALPAPLPGFVDPCLATLTDRAPSGARWIHEIKYDGYRVQAHRDGDAISLYTRRGYDWTDRFGALRAAIERLPANKAIFDGEVIYPDGTESPTSLFCRTSLSRVEDEASSTTSSIFSTWTALISVKRL